MSARVSNTVVQVVIGVDVGGTNTDAVVLSKTKNEWVVISAAKKLTSTDVTTGVCNAIYAALKQATDRGHNVGVVQVNIGTTHFLNAVVQRKGLAKVSVIRLCGTTSRDLPPFSDFQPDLKEVIFGSVYLCDGGYRVDGREIDPINEKEISDIVTDIRAKGIENIVLSGIFSPMRPDQEKHVHNMITELYIGASVTLSHTLGHIGLLERENAAILNECLKPVCKRVTQEFRNALGNIGLSCPFYLTQNDGTLISSDCALLYPVHTIASGPVNSMRGAACLSGVRDAVVLDIGGTTSDVGVLINGLPREASLHIEIGGVRTNLRMPDILSIGLGGGSYVQEIKGDSGNLCSVTVGPMSAGYNLKNEALIFGSGPDDKSRYLTTSDIAVAAGMLNLGSPNNVSTLSKELIKMSLSKIVTQIEDAVDMIKISGDTLPLIAVGGGSALLDKAQIIRGTSDVIIPEFASFANAFGAAISIVSGRVDNAVAIKHMAHTNPTGKTTEQFTCQITDDPLGQRAEEEQKKFFDGKSLEDAIYSAKDTATVPGLYKDCHEIAEKADSVLSCIPDQAARIKIKSFGNISRQLQSTGIPSSFIITDKESRQAAHDCEKQKVTCTGKNLSLEPCSRIAIKHPLEPYIDPQTEEWILSEWDVEAIVIGAGIFGCGGGGNTHVGRLKALAAIRKGKKIRIVSPEMLYQNRDPVNDLVSVVAFMGSPEETHELLPSTKETTGAFLCLQDLYTAGGYQDGILKHTEGVKIKTKDGMKFIENYQVGKVKPKNIVALMLGEIGGINAIEPLLVSADLDIPVVDADGMGRAFPELQMFCPYIYGLPAYPAALVDGRGNRTVMLNSPSPKHLENHFREIVTKMGSSCGLALTPLNKSDIMNKSVLYSISHAWRLGDAILRARLTKTSTIKTILDTEKSVHVLTGTIRDVQSETSGGFNHGRIEVEGQNDFKGRTILLEFKNEFLVIFPLDENKQKGKAIASVPDLITIVDVDTAEPIPIEEVKYGRRVAVLVLASPAILRTEQALKYVGPQALHYENVYFTPIGDMNPTIPIPPKNKIN